MEINQIKARLSIREVLARYGYRPDASGRMKCPFHDDKTPSFQVYLDTNRFTCFAASCQAGSGDVIDFIQLKQQCSTHEAILQARAWVEGLPATTNGTPPATSLAREEVDPETRRFVVGTVFDRFGKSLRQSKTARAYLEGRSLDVDHLEAGYNSGQWVKQLMDPSANETGALKHHATALGLILPDGRAFARSCVVLPLKDAAGQIVSLYGRSIRRGPARHFYLRHRQGLYPGYPSDETRRLILTEAILDAASVLQADLPGFAVLSLFGTGGWTPEHAEALKRLPALEELVLFFDGDEPGRAAAEELAGVLRTLCPGAVLSQVETPDGEDANSLLCHSGVAALGKLIKARTVVHRPSSSSETFLSEAARVLDTSRPEALRFVADPLEIAVLGGIKLTGLDRLRVTLKIERLRGPSALPLRHNLDLYHASQVDHLTDRAAEEFELERRLIRQTLSGLTDALERYRLQQIEALSAPKPEQPVMTPEQAEEALAYLRAPKLLERTSEDIGKSGVVGEEANRLLMYLAFTSRKRARPLQVISLAKSGTGKTYLQETVARLIPAEDRLEITALSENALYYFGRTELRHKLILIEDLDGADEVLYPLRELQSKGRLAKTVAIKDTKGAIRTVTVTVEGPVCVAGCTTRERLFEDNATRCLLLYLDQTSQQNAAVLRYQQRLSAGTIDRSKQARLRRLLQNVQRLLKPISVRNPYAERLSLPPSVFTQRRSNQIYLDLIETVTFYHQHQRSARTDEATGEVYIETSIADIEAANALIVPVLTSKSDELTDACRLFLEHLKKWLAAQQRQSFYASEVRQVLRLSPTSLKRYLGQLRGLGYVELLGGSRYRKGYEYGLTGLGRLDSPRAEVVRFLAGVLKGLKRRESAA